MLWQDEGVVLARAAMARARPWSACSPRPTAATPAWCAAAPAAGRARSTSPATALRVTWRARLAEQLGSFSAELQRTVAARLLDHPDRLAALGAACALLEASLPERDPHPLLYRELAGLD